MKLSAVVLKFLQDGTLGPISCQLSRAEVLKEAGMPDYWDDYSRREKLMSAQVWSYGPIQIHFEQNRIAVFGIYPWDTPCPPWAEIGDFPKKNSTISEMITLLNQYGIPYEHRPRRSISLILTSGVKITGSDQIYGIICDCIPLPRHFLEP